MAPVIALFVVSAIAVVATARVAAADASPRSLPWDLTVNAGKMVTISSGLAAFTITGVVLLLSFAHASDGDIGAPVSVTVGMFLVAFMGLIASSLMYANQTQAGVEHSGIAIQTLQYAVTTMMFFRSVFFGLLALRPLIEAYGFNELAEQMGWLILVLAVAGGWTSSIAVLYRLGLVRVRAVVFVPLASLVGCAVAALAFELWFPGARSDASPLYLGYALFGLNALSFLAYAVLPAALEHPRVGPLIARVWTTAVAAVAVVSGMTIGFVWLATAELL